MSIDTDEPQTPGKGKIFAGIALLFIGLIFLSNQLDFVMFPHWLFRYPMWMIIGGLYLGSKNNFQKGPWLIFTIISFALLLNGALPDYHLGNLVWPLGIIAVGIWIISRRNKPWNLKNDWTGSKWEQKYTKEKYRNGNPFEPIVDYTVPPVASPVVEGETIPPAGASSEPAAGASASSTNIPPLTGDDHLDTLSVFGGVNKTIFSKNFRGGEIVNIFGGAEIDLTRADINGRVIIDVTQIFGGTKIIVPSNWKVVSDMAAIFASVDDKRIKSIMPSDDKVLIIKGISIFAGVDIRSY